MDRHAMLRAVNARSQSRYGSPITDSMLDDLNEERVMSGPRRQSSRGPGANYQYGDEDLRRLTHIRWLKARGMRRNSQLRIYLSLAHFDVPLELIREDLKTEYHRQRQKMLRPITSTYSPTDGAPTERIVATLSRQMGTLDSRLLPDGQGLSPLGLVDMYGLMRSGRHSAAKEQLHELVMGLGLNEWPEGAVDTLIRLVVGCFANVLSAPDESDVAMEALILSIDEATYMRARGILDQLPWILVKFPKLIRTLGINSLTNLTDMEPNFRFVARVLFQVEWRLIILIQIAMAIWNGSAASVFHQQLVALVRTLRDIPSDEISRTEIADRMRQGFGAS